jgi:twitching motility protein PilT
MALLFGDKKTPLQRLKRGDFKTQDELRELMASVAADEDLRIQDFVWALTDPRRDLRSMAHELIISRGLPGTYQSVLREACAQPAGPQRRLLVALLPRIQDPQGFDLLTQLMEKGKGEAPEVAAEVMLSYPLDQIHGYVARFLRLGDEEMRLRALGKLQDDSREGHQLERGLRTIVNQMCTDASDRVRLRAFQVLAKDPDSDFIRLILERLRHERFTVKQQLIRILESTTVGHDSGILDELIPLLGEGDDLVRNAALKIATRAGDPREVIRRIILYSKTLMGWMRDRIHQTISEFGDQLLDPIIDLMGHQDPVIRSSALLFAVNHDSQKLVAPIVRLLGDEDWWTRVVAMDTLGRLKATEAVEPLVRALSDPDVRWSAVEALSAIGDPRALPAIAKLLGDKANEVRLEVIRALELFNDPRGLKLLQQVVERDPELEVRERAMEAFKKISAANEIAVDEAQLKAGLAMTAATDKQIDRLLVQTRKMGASDFHLSPGTPASVRKNGVLVQLGERVFTADETAALCRELMTPKQREAMKAEKHLDFCYDIRGAGRYRVNVYEERLGTGAVFRVIPNEVPNFETTGLPHQLTDIANLHQGLVIVSGASGSGKTTTLAAFINLLNESKRTHVITLEDPIEYVHPYKNSLINQREVGTHTRGFPEALRAALREDPDVIVVGEMRDAETMRLAITAAETGHLVIATMHTTSAPKCVTRLVDSFSVREQAQIRIMLSETLKTVLNQALLPRADGQGQVANYEILHVTPALSNLIRDNKMTLIPSLMTIGKKVGMVPFDDGLMDLVNRGLITAEAAYMRARVKDDFEPLVSAAFLEGLDG